jgi:hypothetical protein
LKKLRDELIANKRVGIFYNNLRGLLLRLPKLMALLFRGLATLRMKTIGRGSWMILITSLGRRRSSFFNYKIS